MGVFSALVSANNVSDNARTLVEMYNALVKTSNERGDVHRCELSNERLVSVSHELVHIVESYCEDETPDRPAEVVERIPTAIVDCNVEELKVLFVLARESFMEYYASSWTTDRAVLEELEQLVAARAPLLAEMRSRYSLQREEEKRVREVEEYIASATKYWRTPSEERLLIHNGDIQTMIWNLIKGAVDGSISMEKFDHEFRRMYSIMSLNFPLTLASIDSSFRNLKDLTTIKRTKVDAMNETGSVLTHQMGLEIYSINSGIRKKEELKAQVESILMFE